MPFELWKTSYFLGMIQLWQRRPAYDDVASGWSQVVRYVERSVTPKASDYSSSSDSDDDSTQNSFRLWQVRKVTLDADRIHIKSQPPGSARCRYAQEDAWETIRCWARQVSSTICRVYTSRIYGVGESIPTQHITRSISVVSFKSVASWL